LKVGWGKPTPLKPEIAAAVERGATRNVFIGNFEGMTPDALRTDLSRFGDIDVVNVLPEKRIAFVHFTNITSAIAAVEALPQEEKYTGKRVAYGKDRAAKIPGQIAGGDLGALGGLSGLGLGSFGLPGLSQIAPSLGISQDLLNRTVYLGNIHPETTYTELCDNIKGGNIAQVRILEDKRCAFVTFVEPEAAQIFHRYCISAAEGLQIHNQRVRAGWGKPGGLPASVEGAVSRGATRNVYLGGIDVEATTEQKLAEDLGKYGTIEKVNILAEKQLAFVHFTAISAAVKAVQGLRQDPYYSKFKINYGKDRCAKLP